MSILDTETIDGMAIGKGGKELRLLINDVIDWNDEYYHLLKLQEKINSYLTFCESHQYETIYENNIIKYAIFEIHFKYSPSKKAIAFLNEVQKQVNEMGIAIEYCISEE